MKNSQTTEKKIEIINIINKTTHPLLEYLAKTPVLRATVLWLNESLKEGENSYELIDKIFSFYHKISFNTEMLDHSRLPFIVREFKDLIVLPDPISKKVVVVYFKNKIIFDQWIVDVEKNKKVLPDQTLKRKHA